MALLEMAGEQRKAGEQAEQVGDGHPLMAEMADETGNADGIWLSMMATRHAREVGVASALMATTPLFLMPIAALCYGARIGWRGLVGTLLAVGGAALLFAR